ncbi:PDZ domain-containing protein [Lysobacter claricitrinus]|uniref:PDZ domain-containing protein n=1 Tax=Lysobacter claricitrinus TaxID=3367728 RepID=UPI0037DBBC31
MFRPTALRAATAASLAFAMVTCPASAAKGRLGFAVDIETAGFFLAPTLERVTVKTVMAGSPASAADLRPGDQVLEIDGAAVRGLPARPLGNRLQSMKAGDHLRMTVRHADGRVARLELIAAG